MRSQRNSHTPAASGAKTEDAELAQIFAAHGRALAAFEQVLAAHGQIAAINGRIAAQAEQLRRTAAESQP